MNILEKTLSSSEFEEELCFANMDKLDKCFQIAKKAIYDKGIECDALSFSDLYPGYIYGNQIRLKMPTFSIRIINDSYSKEQIDKMLSNFEKIFVYVETNVWIDKSIKSCISVLCLESELTKNVVLAEDIMNALAERDIASEKCISSTHYCINK